MAENKGTATDAMDGDIGSLAKDLDALITKSDEKKPVAETVVETLSKAVDALAATSDKLSKGELVVSHKHVTKPDEGVRVEEPADNKRRNGGKDNDDDDVDDAEKSLLAKEDFFKSLLEGGDPEVVEQATRLLDSSPVLERLTRSMGESVEDLTKADLSILRKIEVVTGAVGILLKSQLALHKMLAAMPRQVAPGVFLAGTPGGLAKGGGEDGGYPLSKAEVRDRVTKGVQDGKLEPIWLAKIDSPYGFAHMLESVDHDVLKSCGIPIPASRS